MALQVGKELVLVLSRGTDLKSHTIKFVTSIKDVVSKWNWSTRTSPIFPLNGSVQPDLLSSKSIFKFCFVGPLAPKFIPTNIPAFLTFGTYNVLLVARTSAEKKSLQVFLDGYPQVPWELWTVQKERLLKWECNQSLNYSADYPAFKDNWLTSAGLRSAQEENVTLLAASIAKAEKYFPENAKELREFRNEFNALLAGELAGHEIVKLSYLVNVNAVLSRYTSQTFSGTSPIIETECHFWTHSLLGVGVATQALVKFRRFIDKSTELHSPIVKLASYQNRLPYRFKSDNGENVFTTTLFELSSSEYDTRWKPLEKIVSESNVKSSQKSNKELPLLVCFSGRDGFKSTMFSLTAPLEVISCCNTYGWTPMTLTHELCHVWVSDALGMLFPEMLDPTRFKDLERLKDGIPPASLFEQIQQAFYYCFTLLHKESVGAILSKVPKGKQKSAIQILASQSRTIEELITHILDFRFFYKKNQGLYVNSIWSSWDVIPSIRDRLPHYIMRTACAILSDKLNEENCLEETLKVLATYLADLHSITENGQYLAEAIQLLDEQKKEFLARLDARSFLVRMIVTFFPSGDFSTSLEHERPVKGGMYNSMSPGKFKVGESILNPLSFVSHFACDREVNRKKSIWMLHYMAFAEYD